MNKNKCNGEFGCAYSRSMNQEYPRKCIKCGHPEIVEISIDRERQLLSRTQIFEIKDIVQLLALIEQRNYYVKQNQSYFTNGLTSGENYILDMISHCNKTIEKLLNLK